MTPLLMALSLLSTPASADDCTFYYLSNQGGPSWTASLLPASSTYSTNSRGNTSFRYDYGDMVANVPDMIEDVRSVRITAADSDVAAYIYTGDDFDGTAVVFHCEKGQTCDLDSLGGFNDMVRSFSCQREFGRAANTSPIQNTVIDSEQIRAKFENTINSAYAALSGVVYSHESTTLSWQVMTDFCTERGLSCASTWQNKYRDLWTVEHDFIVRPDWWSWDYQASIGYVIEPVLDSGSDLQFLQVERSIFVEAGLLSTLIGDSIYTELSRMDVPTLLRDGILLAAGDEFCTSAGFICTDADRRLLGSLVVDSKERFQFSYFDSTASSVHPTAAQFSFATGTDSREPMLVLNALR